MEVVAWDLAKTWASMGHTVVVVTTKIPGRSETFRENGVSIISLANTIPGEYRGGWWAASRGAITSGRLDRPDVILSVSAAVYGALHQINHQWRTPVVFQSHGTSFGEFLSKIRTRSLGQVIRSARNLVWYFKDAYLYKSVSRVVVVGSSVAGEFRTKPTSWIAPLRKTETIYNGVNESEFAFNREVRQQTRKSLGWGANDPVFIYSGRLHPQKGCLDLISAFILVRRHLPNARLLLVGGGESEEKIKTQNSALIQEGFIALTGPVKREDLPQYLSAADTFVFLTKRNEVGATMNLLEAMASGLECIVSNLMGGIFPDGKSLTFPKSDLSESVAEEMIASIGRSSPDRNSILPSDYSLSHSAEAYLKLFDRIRKERIRGGDSVN